MRAGPHLAGHLVQPHLFLGLLDQPPLRVGWQARGGWSVKPGRGVPPAQGSKRGGRISGCAPPRGQQQDRPARRIAAARTLFASSLSQSWYSSSSMRSWCSTPRMALRRARDTSSLRGRGGGGEGRGLEGGVTPLDPRGGETRGAAVQFRSRNGAAARGRPRLLSGAHIVREISGSRLMDSALSRAFSTSSRTVV